MNHQELHQEALLRVKEFTDSTIKLMEILERIDCSKAYINLGFSSLWSYVTIGLKLSESQAQQFISVMRKSKEVPALKLAVANGDASLPKAALIVSEIKQDNQNDWLEKASTLSTRNLKVAVAKENPKAIPQERITARTEEIFELMVGLKKEVIEEIKRSQDVLSQKERRAVGLDEVLAELAKTYLEKYDPQKKAERALCADKVKVTPLRPGRNPHPAWVKHKIHQKYQGQCAAVHPNGQRCDSKRFLEIHHIIPLNQGGSNHPDNLILLCSGHHKVQHLAC